MPASNAQLDVGRCALFVTFLAVSRPLAHFMEALPFASALHSGSQLNTSAETSS
jgi:hypothetical protein